MGVYREKSMVYTQCVSRQREGLQRIVNPDRGLTHGGVFRRVDGLPKIHNIIYNYLQEYRILK